MHVKWDLNGQNRDCNKLKSSKKCLICHLVGNTASNQVIELSFCVKKTKTLSIRTLKYLKELFWTPSCSSSTCNISQYLDQNYLQMFFIGSFIIVSDLSTCAGGCSCKTGHLRPLLFSGPFQKPKYLGKELETNHTKN